MQGRTNRLAVSKKFGIPGMFPRPCKASKFLGESKFRSFFPSCIGHLSCHPTELQGWKDFMLLWGFGTDMVKKYESFFETNFPECQCYILHPVLPSPEIKPNKTGTPGVTRMLSLDGPLENILLQYQKRVSASFCVLYPLKTGHTHFIQNFDHFPSSNPPAYYRFICGAGFVHCAMY
ncbi:hypothetical protein GWK47_051769 [Chionoecetes opilio]|uniref:Uncharacterized protein n=1 Tax=Chionoecetes opilio TaxID=41210 RepID=A0A8J4Y1U6_CHIOP|nr:hypothetical protein GWK47_051769 [Chionoecetes opilio]